MNNQDNLPAQAVYPAISKQALRQRAEEKIKENIAQSSVDLEEMSPQETQRLIYELRVHQIQLEMQNDELLRAQVELEDARERYLGLYDFAPVSYCTISEKGLIMEANLTAATLLGIARGMLIKQPFSRFIFKEDQDVYYLHRQHLFATGEPQEYELRMTKKDGTVFWSHLVAITLQDADGTPICRVVINDITESKLKEEAEKQKNLLKMEMEMLRRKEKEYLEILDGSTEGSWIIDLQNNTMEYSEQWLKRIGAENIPFKEIYAYADKLVHPDDREKTYKDRDVALKGKSTKFKTEYRLKTVDSGYIWVLDQGKVEYNENGVPTKIYGTSIDFSDRKKMELALKSTAADLEQKNKLITDFFINLSHEFRTPISIMMLATELIEHYLKQTDFNREDLTKHMEPIKQNTFRLSKLVNNLLDITKLDAGFWKPSLVDEDMVGILKYLVKSLKGLVNKRSLNITFTCLKKIIMMPTDIQMIDRIMLNLISNALKHTPKGGFIKVDCQDFEDKIVISVRDNGEGIPDDKKDIIFDRFRQVNTSLTRSSEGCGIGLSLVKSMVETLGGRIWFESILGEGSEFFVELPVLKIDEQHQSIEIGGLTLEQRIQIEFSDIAFN